MALWLGAGLLTLGVLVTEVFSSTQFIYMTSYCSRTLQINNSISLALTSDNLLSKDRNDLDFVHCALDLTSPPGWKLFVHFLQLSIAPETHHVDRVELFDMEPKKVRITPPQGLYGKLERQLFIYDDSGIFIEDYRSSSRKLRIDYLGKPTIKNPGFRVLVTAFKDPDEEGNCPAHWFQCPHQRHCIPMVTTCDGLSNCGTNDFGDEDGCQLDNKVTNLLENYSLVRDILLVVILPLAIFIAIVLALILCMRRHIRKRFPDPEPPSVHFSPRKGGQIQILQDNHQELTRQFAPPSYEDTVEPPPAYSSLANLAEEGAIVMGSEEDLRRASPRDRRHRSSRLRKHNSGSASSIEIVDSREDTQRKLSQYERYRRYKSCPSDSDNDDEETKKRRRKKGGGKGKGKRRTDEVPIELHPVTSPHGHTMSSSPHGPSPLASPSSASAHSVPYDDSSITDVSRTSPSSASSPDHKPCPAVLPVSSSQGNKLLKTHADNCSPIYVNTSPARRPPSQNSKADSHKFDSSGTEADRKSETESRSPSKRNSHTESLASSAESVKQHSNDSPIAESDKNISKIKRDASKKLQNGTATSENGTTFTE